MVLHITLMMSIVSFVTVSIAMVLYAVNSSYIKRLVSKSKEHENEMINRAVVQDNKIRNVVDAVNNNDDIADRENKRLEKHVTTQITDLLTKNKNTDDKLQTTSINMDDRLKNLNTQIQNTYDNLDEKIEARIRKDAELDSKFMDITNSNNQLTRQLTHANEHLIQSNSNYVMNFEGRTLNEFERVQKNVDDNHTALLDKILDNDTKVRADFVDADDIVKAELRTHVANTKNTLTNQFNERLNNYVMTSTLNDYQDHVNQMFSTKLENQANSARILDLENMNIEQRFNDVHDQIHNVEDNLVNSNLLINQKHTQLRNDFDNFKVSEYASFSNLVLDRQQRNFDDLKSTFGLALSNLDRIVVENENEFESHFATKAYTLSNFYEKPELDTLLDAKQSVIQDNVKDYIFQNDVKFRGFTGEKGDQGVGITKIEKNYNENTQKDYIDFTLTNDIKSSIEVPSGTHGTSLTNLRIDNGYIVYDKTTYDNLTNEPTVERGLQLGLAPTNGVDGINGTDGIGIDSIQKDDILSPDNLTPDNHYTRITINLSRGPPIWFDIPHGKTGVSIESVDLMTNEEINRIQGNDKTTNVYYKIVLSNGVTRPIIIPKGLKGDKGDKGDAGEFVLDNYELTLDTSRGLCLKAKGGNFARTCLDFQTIKNKIYTKDEYLPGVNPP